jgi:hypothetical protein
VGTAERPLATGRDKFISGINLLRIRVLDPYSELLGGGKSFPGGIAYPPGEKVSPSQCRDKRRGGEISQDFFGTFLMLFFHENYFSMFHNLKYFVQNHD